MECCFSPVHVTSKFPFHWKQIISPGCLYLLFPMPALPMLQVRTENFLLVYVLLHKPGKLDSLNFYKTYDPFHKSLISFSSPFLSVILLPACLCAITAAFPVRHTDSTDNCQESREFTHSHSKKIWKKVPCSHNELAYATFVEGGKCIHFRFE